MGLKVLRKIYQALGEAVRPDEIYQDPVILCTFKYAPNYCWQFVIFLGIQEDCPNPST